jgi:hypothetical protein
MISGTYPADVALRVLDDFLDGVFSPAAGRP